MSVGELASQMPVSRPAVSQHLRILGSANLVRQQSAGTRHYFSLNPEGFAEVQSYVNSLWQDALQSFADYVARQEAVKKRRSKRKKR
jgi:DNA-binding transcriptional ArsR family regulator